MGIRYQVKVAPGQQVAVLRVEGELDFDEREKFARAVKELVAAEAPSLVVDMSRIVRLSSVFIGELVKCAHSLKADNRSLSVSVPRPVARICRESGLDRVTNLIVAGEEAQPGNGGPAGEGG